MSVGWMVGHLVRSFSASNLGGVNATFVDEGCIGVMMVYATREAAEAARLDPRCPIFEVTISGPVEEPS